MPNTQKKRRRLTTVDVPVGFPFPTTAFSGRNAELRRGEQLLEHEPVICVYGVGGIGKTEFVLKLVENFASRRAAPMACHYRRVAPGVSFREFLTIVLADLRPAKREAARISGSGSTVRELCWLLEDNDHTVFIDDAHHLDQQSLREFISILSRNVRRSRVIVASRREIEPTNPGCAAIFHLEPLERDETAELVTRLANRLGVSTANTDDIFRLSHGSPFYVQRELVDSPSGDDDPLAQTIISLSAEAKHLLLVASLAANGIERESVTVGAGYSDGALERLRSLFLIEPDRASITVHDLVRDAVRRVSTAKELEHASLKAALSLVATGRSASLVEAAALFIKAGQFEEAWSLVSSSYRAIVDAGLDAMLLGSLEKIRDALASVATDADMMRARIYLRQSDVTSAKTLLTGLGRSDAVGSYYLDMLHGDTAIIEGQLDDGALFFEEAIESAGTSDQRLRAACLAASANGIRGDFETAARNIQLAKDMLPESAPQSQAYVYWAESTALILEGRFDEAARLCSDARGSLESAPEDLVLLISFNEAVGNVEIDRISDAAAVVERIRHSEIVRSRFRVAIEDLSQGFVAAGRGDLIDARASLMSALEWFRDGGDWVYTVTTCYAVTDVLHAAGELDRAYELISNATEMSVNAGALVFASYGYTKLSRIAFDRDGPESALRFANSALGLARLPLNATVRAHCARANALALSGETAEAREALEQAIALAASMTPATQRLVKASRVQCALFAGNFELPINVGGELVAEYQRVDNPVQELRMLTHVAAAHICRNSPGDTAIAKALLNDFSTRLGRSRPGVPNSALALLRAAVLHREGDGREASQVLVDGLRDHGLHKQDMVARQLRAAIGSGGNIDLPIASIDLLGKLGLVVTRRFELIEIGGVRRFSSNRPDVSEWTFIVDLDASTISFGESPESFSGHPIMCRLLAALIGSRTHVVDGSTLFRAVWERSEFHKLRDGNRLYVSISRLRKLLRKVVGDQEIIVTLANGWRIADGVKACAVRAA